MFTPVTSNPDPKSAAGCSGAAGSGAARRPRMGQCQQYKSKGKKGWFLSTESHFDKQTAEGATSRSNGLENNEQQALGAVECEDGSY